MAYQIASIPASVSCSASLSQNRRILQPCASRYRLLAASTWSSCCEPSSSTINFSDTQQKSAMYGGIGCWRRNFKPSSCPPRSCCQSFCSASVISRRKRREFSSVVVGSGGLTVVISPDRKSVVEGKSVSERVDLGGRRIIKK